MGAQFEINDNGDEAVIKGAGPVATVGNYQAEVNAYTRGKGVLRLKMSGYRPCHNTDEVIEQIGYEAESMFKRKLLSSMEKLLKVRQKLSGSIIRQSLIIYMILYQQLSHRLLCMSSSVLKDLRCLRRLLIIVTRRIWL